MRTETEGKNLKKERKKSETKNNWEKEIFSKAKHVLCEHST